MALNDVLIVYAPFVVCWVGAFTKDTFGRGVSRLCAHTGWMVSATFYTGIWFVAVSLRVPIVLTSGALWCAHIGSRGFE